MTLDEIALSIFITAGMITAGASIYSQIRDKNYHKSDEVEYELQSDD